MRTRRPFALLALLPLLVVLGCSADSEEPPQPPWEEVVLPDHPGPSGRVVVRDAVHCGGHWYVVGGVVLDDPTDDQDTRPALWRSGDGTSWTPVPVDATTFWGRRAVLGSVACSGDRVAMVGSRAGGGHGNPRYTTFHAREDGTVVDVAAPFNLYGGITASNVGPMAGGPPGWLIAGNRVSGPAVWLSADATRFTILEGAPGLADDAALTALAQSAAWSEDPGWTVVGGGTYAGRPDRDPVAWVSPDGRTWARQDVPGTGEFDDLSRALWHDGRLVALGVAGDRFAAWAREDGTWGEPRRFGATADDAHAAPYAASLTADRRGLLATLSDGSVYRLWRSADGTAWEEVEVPLRPTTAGDHALVVAGTPRRPEVLLVADGGAGGRVWRASVPRT